MEGNPVFVEVVSSQLVAEVRVGEGPRLDCDPSFQEPWEMGTDRVLSYSGTCLGSK